MLYGSNIHCLDQRHTLKRACEARRIDMGELPGLLGIDTDGFFRRLRDPQGLAMSDLARVCDFFSITLDSFLTGFIDTAWIREPALPEKYTRSLGSRVRTSLPSLAYAREIGGAAFHSSILRTLKIPESALANPDRFVSIALLSDVLRFISRRGMGADHFMRMGWKSAALEANAAIGGEFTGLSPRKVFEKLFDETILRYERNFDYRIVRAHDQEILVEVTPKPERVDELQTRRIDNLFVSHYRHGACAAHLKFAGRPIARSELISSSLDGNLPERFRLAW